MSVELERIIVRLVGDATSYLEMLKNAKKETEVFGDHIMQTLGHASRAIGGVGLAIGGPVVAAIGMGVKAYADFNHALVESQAIMKVNEEQNRRMIDAAIDLSTTTKNSATDVAKAYYFLASAGYTTNQVITTVPTVARFAQASMIDMERATSLLSNAQVALGLKVDDVTQNLKNMTRVSDVLTRANELADGTTVNFAKALAADAAPSLRSFHKDVEEGVAILAVYADQGIKNEVAGGHLGRVLRFLAQKSLENAEAHKTEGISVFDATGKMRNMADIIESLENRFKGLGDEQRQQILINLGYEARVQRAIIPLVGMSQQLRKYEAAFREAGGTTDQVANRQMKSFSNQMTLMWHQIQAFGISIGETLAPSLLVFGSLVQGIFASWKTIPEGLRTMIVLTAAVTGGFILLAGAIFTAGVIFNVMFGGVGALIGLVVVAGLTFYSFIAGVIVGLGTVTGVFSYMYKKAVQAWEWMAPIRQALMELAGTILVVFSAVWDSLLTVTKVAWEGMFEGIDVNWKDVLKTIVEGIYLVEFSIINMKKAFDYVWYAAYTGWVVVVESVKWFATVYLVELFHSLTTYGEQLFSTVDSYVGNVINNLATNVGIATTSIVNYIKAVFSEVSRWYFATIQGGSSRLIQNIVRIFTNIRELVAGTVKFEDLWQPILDEGSRLNLPEFKWERQFRDITDGVQNDLKEAFDLPEREVSALEEFLRNNLDKMGNELGIDFGKFLMSKRKLVPPEAVQKAKEEGEEIGGAITKGIKDSAKVDAALFRSAEALSRFIEFRQKLLDDAPGNFAERSIGPDGQAGAGQSVRGGSSSGRKGARGTSVTPTFDATLPRGAEGGARQETQIDLLKMIVQNTGRAANRPVLNIPDAELT